MPPLSSRHYAATLFSWLSSAAAGASRRRFSSDIATLAAGLRHADG